MDAFLNCPDLFMIKIKNVKINFFRTTFLKKKNFKKAKTIENKLNSFLINFD